MSSRKGGSRLGVVNVLNIITRLIVGGAQETALLTAALLDESRWRVDVVSGPQTGPEGSLVETARMLGVRLRIEPNLVREIHPVKDLISLVQLIRLIRRGRYSIVHTHSSKAGVLGRIAAKCAGVPIIVHTIHGWSFHQHMSPLQRRFFVVLEKQVARLSNAMVVVSQRDIEKGVGQGIGCPRDYTLIRSGIELDRFGHPRVPPDQVRSELGIPAKALVVGSVTRLSLQKAPLDMAEAFAHIHRLNPEIWFLIVGDGPLRGELEQRIQKLGLGDRTVLTGLRRDVPELMATMDVFVLTSLWEGLPRVLPQAMATGLPIVCTRAEGSVEAVSEDENGFLVEPGEPKVMAAKIELLLKNAALRKRMGSEGRRRVSEFSAAKMVDEIDHLYQSLLSKAGVYASSIHKKT